MFTATLPFIFAGLALAQSDGETHPYVQPSSSDIRGPCPGLNSLANHNFLPHNGKNIGLQQFVDALKDGLNVGIDVGAAIGGLGLGAAPTEGASTIDLDMLDEHNFPIEHDASISRQDHYFGDWYHFDQSVFDETLALVKGDIIDIPTASHARYQRVKQCLADNPECVYGPRELVATYGETAFYLSTMGDPVTGNAPIKYVKSMFENQTLPYHLGWTKPKVETNFATLELMIVQLQAANSEELIPEGLTVGANALKDVYDFKDPITGKLMNTTCAIAGNC